MRRPPDNAPTRPRRDEPESLGGDEGSVGQTVSAINITPLAIDGDDLAPTLGISPRHVETLHASGRLPRPVWLGKRRLWVVDEIRSWLAAGAPPREQWDAIRDREVGS